VVIGHAHPPDTLAPPGAGSRPDSRCSPSINQVDEGVPLMRAVFRRRRAFANVRDVGLTLVLGALGGLFAAAQQTPGARAEKPPAHRDAIPQADPPFQGVANRTLTGSKPDYPKPVEVPKDAPNVLLVLVDDAGFGNPSTFGGPCQTPTLTKLASQ